MSGRDPWESQRAFQPTTSTPGLFSGPNLPFTMAIIIAVGSLAAFLLLADPFATTSTAAPTTTSATTTSSSTPGDGTSTTAPTDSTASTSTTIPVDLGSLEGLALETIVTSGVAFPVFATSIPGDDRIFVVERQGRILVIDGNGVVLPEPFLDITDRVGSGGIENGALGMAFHPDYASNGQVYVYYTDLELDSRLSLFTSSGLAANTANRSSEEILFEVDQEGIRHRAGMLEFGPDGYLWIAMGDGGLGDDSAQNVQTMQGNIHRIDVDNGDPYAIPPDNPYADGVEGRPEIWAHGLRNPWRFDIDDETRTIYIADVGQETWEEINVASIDTPGLDFGWPNFEATECFLPSDGCDMTGWEAPLITYDHGQGCSITGGYVYRGSQIPELVGHYFYGDWCTGIVRSFKLVDGEATEQRDWTSDLEGAGQVASFGLDGNGELLVVDSNGTLYRIVPVR